MTELNVGDKFGRLTVTGPACSIKGYLRAPVLCECGVAKIVLKQQLLNGGTRSCGCLHRERSSENAKKLFTTHKKTNTPLYGVWSAMKARCYKPKCKEFPLYGARGISVCDEWIDDFAAFHEWAVSHGYQKGLQIDRIDNNGNYLPGNCHFVTPSRNCRNKRSCLTLEAFGETKTLADWVDDPRCVVSYSLAHSRIRISGWGVEEALTTGVLK